MKHPPGIMLYLENLDPIKQLTKEEQGDLLVAILEYGSNGTLPHFEGTLAVVWLFIQPKIKWDIDKYHAKVSTKRYGTYCREAARRGEIPVSHECWDMLNDEEQKRLLSGDTTRYPTTTPTTPPTAASTLSATASAASTKSDHRRCQVTLSPYNMDTLRAKMGEETLQRYLDKLSNLIATDPTYDGNHYLTILEWWRQGCQD